MKAPLRRLALVFLASVLTGCLGGSASVPPPIFGPDAGRADWWIDPGQLPLEPAARTVRGFLLERACASGSSPEGRILGPRIEYRADAIIVTYRVREIGGRCPSNPRFSITVSLTEDLGSRRLLDGGVDPPRDASIDPTVVVEPTVDCGPLVGTDEAKMACLTLVAEALGDRYAEFGAVAIEPRTADCNASICTGREAIEARTWVVTAIDLPGARFAWTCTYQAETAACTLG